MGSGQVLDSPVVGTLAGTHSSASVLKIGQQAEEERKLFGAFEKPRYGHRRQSDILRRTSKGSRPR